MSILLQEVYQQLLDALARKNGGPARLILK